VIRFRDITKESFSSVIAFCFAKLAWTETNRDDLKLLLDPQREDVVLFYLIVDHRAPPDERQGNLSCIFTTSLSPEQYAVVVLVTSISFPVPCHSGGYG
jgi:hypothetical protein